MENLSTAHPFSRKIKEGWGKLRRLYLCHLRPGAVKASIARRKGACQGCAECCDLLFRCPYLDERKKCTIYDRRFKPCAAFPIDERDVRDIACGFYFDREGAEKRLLGLPLAPWAKREILLAGLASIVGGGAGLAIALLDGLPGGWVATAAFAAFLAFSLFFFRNPARLAPEGTALLSPADGRVTDVHEVDEPDFFKGRVLRVGVFMSLFDVHVNRAPGEGRVLFSRHRDGAHGNVMRRDAWERNENVLLGLGTDRGPVGVRLVAGAVARRIVVDRKPGDRVIRGGALGMVKFGSRAELMVPAEAGWKALVREGDRVKGGVTPLMEKEEADREAEGGGP